MTSCSSRAYAGVEDLRRMQAAVARAFAHTSLRVGDLAWLTRHHTHRELSLDIRIWENDNRQLTGWTFFRSNGAFNVFVAPGHEDPGLIDEMLTVIEEAAQRSVKAGDGSVSLHTYVTDDDVVVAFCTAWIDEDNASGLLEPVGTHPAHRRRGLGKAVCLDALRALREAGARTAQVGFDTEAGLATYLSLGFEHSWQDLVFRRGG